MRLRTWAPTQCEESVLGRVAPTKPRFWILAAFWFVATIAVLFGIPAVIGGSLGVLVARIVFAVVVTGVFLLAMRRRS